MTMSASGLLRFVADVAMADVESFTDGHRVHHRAVPKMLIQFC